MTDLFLQYLVRRCAEAASQHSDTWENVARAVLREAIPVLRDQWESERVSLHQMFEAIAKDEYERGYRDARSQAAR